MEELHPSKGHYSGQEGIVQVGKERPDGCRSLLRAASPYWMPDPIRSGSSSPEDKRDNNSLVQGLSAGIMRSGGPVG